MPPIYALECSRVRGRSIAAGVLVAWSSQLMPHNGWTASGCPWMPVDVAGLLASVLLNEAQYLTSLEKL